MKIPFREIAKRITGVSTAVFGVSWEPIKPEQERAQALISYLEDRRALYYGFEYDIPHFVVESIFYIRQRLTKELEEVDRTSELAKHILAMRAAFRKFLNTVGPIPELVEFENDVEDDEEPPLVDYQADSSLSYDDFYSALGELRGTIGMHLAIIVSKYGIDVEDELASIFPSEIENEGEEEQVKKRWGHLED